MNIRPVAFRHPISLVLAFSDTVKLSIELNLYAKIMQIQLVVKLNRIFKWLSKSCKKIGYAKSKKNYIIVVLISQKLSHHFHNIYI